jgi:hypothetical protein
MATAPAWVGTTFANEIDAFRTGGVSGMVVLLAG